MCCAATDPTRCTLKARRVVPLLPVLVGLTLAAGLTGCRGTEIEDAIDKVELSKTFGEFLQALMNEVNALPFLEPPALVNLTLDSLEFNGNIIDADIGLRHPFIGLTEFTGFDVCGVLISNGSISGFSNPDITIAGNGDTRLLHAGEHHCHCD